MFSRAKEAIKTALKAKSSIIVAWSGGKDSSSVLNLTISAAIELVREGCRLPCVYVTTSDTGIENPEIHSYIEAEARKMVAYANANGVAIKFYIATPDLLDTWAVKVIGKRSLPTFPDSKYRECSADMKVKSQKKLRDMILKEIRLTSGSKPIVLLGTRYEESSSRAARMTQRGETDTTPWEDSSGDLYMSPICNWTHDDVWCYLSDCTNGRIPSYSDFQETTRIYKDATGEG